MTKIYNVGIIGNTGNGNYGHHLDTAFKNISNAKIIGIADPNSEGLKQKGQELKISKLYNDYNKLFEFNNIDIAVICPGWVTERLNMIKSAISKGCHIFCEKPFAGHLEEIDEINSLCSEKKLKIAFAHQWRAMPSIQSVLKNLSEKKYGKILRITARPKDDSRGGGEEFLLHGSHLFDLMIEIAGIPQWASGHVLLNNNDANVSDITEGNQPVGPILGDSISAVFGFKNGVRGYFESTANLVGTINPKIDGLGLYGLTIECENNLLVLREPGEVYIYPAPTILPDYENFNWDKLFIDGWHDKQDYNIEKLKINNNWIKYGNRILAKDLINSIQTDTLPLSSVNNVKYINEMVQGVYSSHLNDGKRMSIPLNQRIHPLKIKI